MLQSSLFPGLFFHLYSSAHVTPFPVRNRIVSSADRQKLCRTSTSTPSTSNIKIFGIRSSRSRLRNVGKHPRGRIEESRPAASAGQVHCPPRPHRRRLSLFARRAPAPPL